MKKMNKLEGCFSSKKDDWETPDDLYRQLDNEFHFDLDPCADHNNHKCNLYYTKDENGLLQDWQGHTVFCNPPLWCKIYSRLDKKVCEEGNKPDTMVIMLIPARTDTKAFHEYIYGKAEIRFIKGRLKFGNSKNSAPFPSMIVIFR